MTKSIAKFYTYAHFDYSGICFYVGKGTGGRAYSKYKRNSYWQKVADKGYTVQVLFDNLTETDAFLLEIELIARYSPRTNITLGGNGGCTVNEHTKPIMAKKVAIKKKLWWATKSKEERNYILRNSSNGPKKYWASLTSEQISAEQRRRSSFRPRKKVICLNNSIVYESAKKACEALGINYSTKVSAVCLGNRSHYRGYKFKYA